MAFKTFKDGTIVHQEKFVTLVKKNVLSGNPKPVHDAFFQMKNPAAIIDYDIETYIEAFDDFMATISENLKRELDEEPSANVAGTAIAGLNDGIPRGKKKAPIVTRDVSPEENPDKKTFKSFSKEIKEASYNRGDIQSTLSAAASDAKASSTARFVYATAFGYSIDDSTPPFNQDHYKVDPNGDVWLLTYEHPTAIWSQLKVN